MKKLVKRTLGLGVLAGVGYAIWREYNSARQQNDLAWESQPFPYPPKPASNGSGETTWREPTPSGRVPSGYPVKANSKSKVYRTPGHNSYADAVFDRCYVDAEAAEEDGYHAAKR